MRPTYDQAVLESNGKLGMRTRSTKGQNVTIDSCTEFTLHVSQQSLPRELRKKILDYTQHRLEKYTESVDDPQQKMVLYALLHDYVKGDVAVAWKRGQPVYVKVTKA